MKKLKWSVNQCIDILDVSIGEVEHIIPSDVLEATIEYLKDYKEVKNKSTWDMFPESMGR